MGHTTRSENECGVTRAELRQIEVQTAQGKNLALACREADISERVIAAGARSTATSRQISRER